jgi:hypothetical protein
MLRSSCIATAALLLSLCTEASLAQTPPLSTSVIDPASSPRYKGAASANVARAAAPRSPAEASARCKELAASIEASKASPDRRTVIESQKSNGQASVNSRVLDRRADLEYQARSLDCPQN